MNVGELIDVRSVVACVGSGGVGKTTIAAAIAVRAARAGRHVALITVDPARRLASVLGIDRLANDPRPVDGPWPGSLSAMMLDSKTTFDALVTRYATSDAQRSRILGNDFYQNVTTGLSGLHEYMAMEKLYEVHASGAYDLVVLDTPPSREAVALFNAPDLVTRLLENRIYRVVTAPRRGPLRAVNTAAQSIIRQLARIVGAQVVDDTVAFFQAFEGMEEGFKGRSQAALGLLRSHSTIIALVTLPSRDVIAESRWLTEQLRGARLAPDLMIANRIVPDYGGDVVIDDATQGPVSELARLAALRDAQLGRVRALGAELGLEATSLVTDRAVMEASTEALIELGDELSDGQSSRSASSAS